MAGLDLRAVGQSQMPSVFPRRGLDGFMVDDSLAENNLHARILQNGADSLLEVIGQWLCGKESIPRMDQGYLLLGVEFF